jgi:pimeloyl-ACP methyl ester carboxylesterase
MLTSKRLFLRSKNTRLCCIDFGGKGSPVLLLHGLAGRANEWHSTAQWLTRRYHVFALDQRGHGMSQKGLSDYSREAYVNDVIAVIKQLRLAPVLLIGQSMGGQNAFLVAACRPELVRALIVVEALPGPNPSAQEVVTRWLDSWPLPFASLADARVFFGGETLSAQTWLETLEEHEDGYWPQFRKEEMVRSIQDQVTHDYWSEWERISCPTLIVGGEKSFLPQQQLQEMARRVPNGRYVQVAQVGHDLHLDRPQIWQQITEAFLCELHG